MRKHFSLYRAFIIAAAAASVLSANSLRAADGGSWVNIQFNKGWTDTYAFLRAEHRSFKDFSETEAMFTALGFGYKFTPWLKSDLSYEYWNVNPNVDIHKAVLTSTATMSRDGLAVSIREKLEYAMNPAASSTSLTLRSRLRGQYSIPGCGVTPYAMAEIFNWDKWVRSLYYVGSEIKVGKHSMVDIFYLYHLYPSALGNQGEHVLGVGYYFNF